MIRRIFKGLFLVVGFCAFSQNVKDATLIDQFVDHYNKKEYGLVYALFSDNMQQKTPLVQIEGLLGGLSAAVGTINKAEFVTKDEAGFSHHKTSFEKGTFDVAISEDGDGKMSGFKIVPFVEEDFSRKVSNHLKSKEDLPSTLQTELIFEFCKSFPNQTELAIGFIDSGIPKYYGVKMMNDTLFTVENYQKSYEIGSISKVFTSTLLAYEVHMGKVALEDEIASYFDFPFHQETPITLKALANHSSGLPRLPPNLDLTTVNPQNPYKDYDEAMLDAYLRDELSLASSAVGTYKYSNLGAGLLGYVLAKQAGKTYETLLQANIAEKYGMKNTTSLRDKVSMPLVSGLDAKGKETSNWDFSVLSGAGGILSTMEDMTKFTIAHLDTNNKILQMTTQETIRAKDTKSVGLGWHLLKSESGKDWVWHNGGTGGYTSSLAFNKETQNG
ncbi:MAG: serine hydrolase, partial [Bacteroidota bacterium]